jgi:hypothetical protein
MSQLSYVGTMMCPTHPESEMVYDALKTIYWGLEHKEDMNEPVFLFKCPHNHYIRLVVEYEEKP